MAHVGVERLGAGHREEHAAEHDEAHRPCAKMKLRPGERVQRPQDLPGRGDLDDAERRVHGEEHHHDRPEERGDARRAAALGGEQQDEDDDRRRQDVGRRSASTCFRPSSAERTEIAGVMMASPENRAAPATPSRKAIALRWPSARWASAFSDRMPPSPLLSACMRNRTYLAVTTISKRPDDERDDADHVRSARGPSPELAERGLQRVERAGADVAEHDADRAQREDPELPPECRRRRRHRRRREIAEESFETFSDILLQEPQKRLGPNPRSGGRLYSLATSQTKRRPFRLSHRSLGHNVADRSRGARGEPRSPAAARSRECGRRLR